MRAGGPSHRSSPADQLYHNGYQRKQQQNVNKPADGVCRHHSQNPEQDQNDSNGPQHGTPPLRFNKQSFFEPDSSFEKVRSITGRSTSGAVVAAAQMVKGIRSESEPLKQGLRGNDTYRAGSAPFTNSVPGIKASASGF
jgi:hypothetical protein